jgi:hypothetical protein
MGRQLAAEIERQVKLNEDPTINESSSEAKLLINRAAENNSMMHVIDEHLLDLAANRVRTLSQVTN